MAFLWVNQRMLDSYLRNLFTSHINDPVAACFRIQNR
jgi:hypothetical protein